MFPRISVVTSSYNQGRFIGRTIDSVLAQAYPNLEHLVIDGMSSDETPAVLARYPHLRVLREPDHGQADAVNKGFRLASGDILCFLNSDDVFLPGAAPRGTRDRPVARPLRRHGPLSVHRRTRQGDWARTSLRFIDHERVLKVWEGHWVPQPATFWTREVWEQCGPLDANEQHVLDYDLMCRISQRYRFTVVDQILAGYRLHAQSKTCARSNDWVAEQAVRVSRRYWGSPLALKYWRLLWSLSAHQRHQRAGRLLAAAESAGSPLRRLFLRGQALGASPETVARNALLTMRLWLARWLPVPSQTTDLWQDPGLSPKTLVWRRFTDAHTDGFVGPTYVRRIEVDPGRRTLHLAGDPVIGRLRLPLEIAVFLDGRLLCKKRLPQGPPFSLEAPWRASLPGRMS